MTWAALTYQDITCPSASPVTDMDLKCPGVTLCFCLNTSNSIELITRVLEEIVALKDVDTQSPRETVNISLIIEFVTINHYYKYIKLCFSYLG